MKIIVLLSLLLGVQVAEAVEGVNSPKSYAGKDHPTIKLDAPDVTKTDKTAEWRMWYIEKGTRSEGLHGTITIEGKFVVGKVLKEKRVAAGQKLVWYGTWDERKQLFAKSGWLPEDITTVYPSWKRGKAEK